LIYLQKKKKKKEQEIYKSKLLSINSAITNNLFDLLIIILTTCYQAVHVEAIIENLKKADKLSLSINTSSDS